MSIITLKTAKLAREKGFKFNRDNADISYFRDFEPNDLRYMYNRSVKKYLTVSDYYMETNQNIQQYVHDTEEFPTYDAPTQSELQKWLREEHNNIVEITMHSSCIDCEHEFKKVSDFFYEVEINYYGKDFQEKQGDDCDFYKSDFKTYEEALEKGLQKALKLIK